MISLLLLSMAAPPQPADPCAMVEACREVGDVRIENSAGIETLIPINQKLPWVVQDNLLLVPGNWIIVRLADREGTLVPELVKAGNSGEAPDPADGEIRVKVHSFDKGSLIMEVLSRRPEMLDYAAMVVVGADTTQRTSVCSLRPGVPVFETWQWPIRQIALWSFRPTTEPACKEVDIKNPASG